MLPKLAIQALLRAYQHETGTLAYSKTAQSLADDLGFGRVVGRRWLIDHSDRERIRDYLRAVERIDPATPASAWSDASRIDAAHLGANEKLAGRRPREGRVAVRAAGELLLDGNSIALPAQSFLDLRIGHGAVFGHDAVIVIENFEAFVCYEDASISTAYVHPLLLFRGDAANPSDGVMAFLRRTSLPVLCWPDFDPAGLQIAATLPGCTAILAPAAPVQVLNHSGREDLYLTQLRELEMLALTNECRALEQALRDCRCGLDQERMIAQRIPLRLWVR